MTISRIISVSCGTPSWMRSPSRPLAKPGSSRRGSSRRGSRAGWSRSGRRRGGSALAGRGSAARGSAVRRRPRCRRTTTATAASVAATPAALGRWPPRRRSAALLAGGGLVALRQLLALAGERRRHRRRDGRRRSADRSEQRQRPRARRSGGRRQRRWRRDQRRRLRRRRGRRGLAIRRRRRRRSLGNAGGAGVCGSASRSGPCSLPSAVGRDHHGAMLCSRDHIIPGVSGGPSVPLRAAAGRGSRCWSPAPPACGCRCTCCARSPRARAVERVHLVVSAGASQVLRHELGRPARRARPGRGGRAAGGRCGEVIVHRDSELDAPISSGSYRLAGTVVLPCSAATLGALATGAGTTLVHRAGAVALKERWPLVLGFRETPLSHRPPGEPAAARLRRRRHPAADPRLLRRALGGRGPAAGRRRRGRSRLSSAFSTPTPCACSTTSACRRPRRAAPLRWPP